MADGMNHVRAMRLAELLQEFRNLQHSLSQITPPPDDAGSNGNGQALLKQCYEEGQKVLNAPYSASAPSPNGDPEVEKSQLRQVILDAAARRFQAHCIFLRATAAMRWMNARNAIRDKNGRSQKANLAKIDEELSKELKAITAEKVRDDLKSQDQRSGRWTDEDPDIATIKSHIQSLN